ncbi:hypothetical protein CDD83_438 [Cordyceps sp. RAO-2017]|nr:hypothetical protein CDD83_438 [Cordyceps sp. RAO-2017]
MTATSRGWRALRAHGQGKHKALPPRAGAEGSTGRPPLQRDQDHSPSVFLPSRAGRERRGEESGGDKARGQGRVAEQHVVFSCGSHRHRRLPWLALAFIPFLLVVRMYTYKIDCMYRLPTLSGRAKRHHHACMQSRIARFRGSHARPSATTHRTSATDGGQASVSSGITPMEKSEVYGDDQQHLE